MRPLLLAIAVLGVWASSAAATQVSYVDGGQVWVATLDGAHRTSLSGPSPDAYTWEWQAQSDDGYVLGVRGEPGHFNAGSNAATEWGPDGAVQTAGDTAAAPLTAGLGTSAVIFPVQLNLAPGGRFVDYGYTYSTYTGPGFSYFFGSYTKGVSWSTAPLDLSGIDRPGLAGNRMIGIGHSANQVLVQDATSNGTMEPSFTAWPGLQFNGNVYVNALDASADGKLTAISYSVSDGADVIQLAPFAGLGVAATAADDANACMLATQGDADDVNVSADGRWIAWHDARGIVAAGAPAWFPSTEVSTCNLSSPPVVISATGTDPQLGASTAATPSAPGSTTPPGSTPTTPPATTPSRSTAGRGPAAAKVEAKVAATVKASAFSKGLSLSVTVRAKGPISAVAKVGTTVIARASARAAKAGKVALRLKAPKKLAMKLRRYRGRTLVITIKASGRTLTVKRKLR
jgi:hypothetical protein